jgi:hypothetical protein
LVAGNRAFAAGTAQQPFNATYLVPPTPAHDGYYRVWPGTGSGTFVGNSSYLVSAHITSKTALYIATITAANGDSLYLEGMQTWDADTQTWVGPFTIVGGTGRFANATGGGTMTTMAADTEGTVFNVYDGTISF